MDHKLGGVGFFGDPRSHLDQDQNACKLFQFCIFEMLRCFSIIFSDFCGATQTPTTHNAHTNTPLPSGGTKNTLLPSPTCSYRSYQEGCLQWLPLWESPPRLRVWQGWRGCLVSTATLFRWSPYPGNILARESLTTGECQWVLLRRFLTYDTYNRHHRVFSQS